MIVWEVLFYYLNMVPTFFALNILPEFLGTNKAEEHGLSTERNENVNGVLDGVCYLSNYSIWK